MSEDLIARLRVDCDTFSDPICGEAADALEAQARRIALQEKQIGEFAERSENDKTVLRARIAELEAVFETKWDAEQRAIKAWQEKTGKNMTWPDHAKMVEWLLDELDAARAALENKQ